VADSLERQALFKNQKHATMITGILIGIYLAGVFGWLLATCIELDRNDKIILWVREVSICLIWPVALSVLLLMMWVNPPKITPNERP
jgi:cell shape-determining protein MreD